MQFQLLWISLIFYSIISTQSYAVFLQKTLAQTQVMIIHLDVVMRIGPPCTWQFGHSCVYTTVDWKQQSALMHPPTNTLKPCSCGPVSFRGFSAQPCFSDRSSLISLLCLLPFLGSFSQPHLLVGVFFQHLKKDWSCIPLGGGIFRIFRRLIFLLNTFLVILIVLEWISFDILIFAL